MAKPTTNDGTLDLALNTISQNRQALIFVNSKKSAEKMAEDIAKKVISLSETEKTLFSNLSLDVESALSRPTKQCLRLSKCLKKGIAFHHSGLAEKQKELIEKNFRLGKYKNNCLYTNFGRRT
jgi:helicase